MVITLTKEQVKFYNDNGYLVINNFFEPTHIAAALKAIDEILDCADQSSVAESEPADPSVVRRIWSPSKRHPVFVELAENENLLNCIECLIGPNILFHYSKLNMKYSQVGSVVEWHQDLSYYPHTNTDLLSCLIYLDDATTENACLEVIPGAHRCGILDHYINGYFRGKINNSIPDVDFSKSVPLEAPAGSVIFLHCLTPHYSRKNQSDKPRRTYLPAYRAADAFPIYFGSHASHNEPGIKLLRGKQAKFARIESYPCPLPFAETEFNSLYEVQEGSHITNKGNKSETGYFAMQK
jgi:ectoine hydroxylase-related dioxygenase (phytanoyl-CoA dioxygenase family)